MFISGNFILIFYVKVEIRQRAGPHLLLLLHLSKCGFPIIFENRVPAWAVSYVNNQAASRKE